MQVQLACTFNAYFFVVFWFQYKRYKRPNPALIYWSYNKESNQDLARSWKIIQEIPDPYKEIQKLRNPTRNFKDNIPDFVEISKTQSHISQDAPGSFGFFNIAPANPQSAKFIEICPLDPLNFCIMYYVTNLRVHCMMLRKYF